MQIVWEIMPVISDCQLHSESGLELRQMGETCVGYRFFFFFRKMIDGWEFEVYSRMQIIQNGLLTGYSLDPPKSHS